MYLIITDLSNSPRVISYNFSIEKAKYALINMRKSVNTIKCLYTLMFIT